MSVFVSAVGGRKTPLELRAREARGLFLSVYSVLEDAQRWLSKMGHPWDNSTDGTSELARLWKEHGDEPGWYERPDVSREMLRELSAWHASDENVFLQNASIVHHCGGRVLDYGGGICTLAIAMSIAGSKVEVIEPGPWLRAFGAERAARLGATIRFVDEPEGKYDAIVAIDVVEHLERPAAFLELAAQHLAPNGKIAINWVFQKDAAHPQHINECTPESNEFHKRLHQLFGPALAEAKMTQNGWPCIRELRDDSKPSES